MRWLVVALVLHASTAHADTSKLGKDGLVLQERGAIRGKDKRCCGYPLVGDLQWRISFYWLAMEADYDEQDEVGKESLESTNLYDKRGGYLGTYSERFSWHLRMEGTGVTLDGRILNTSGHCPVGFGTCFSTMNGDTHPFGRGAGWRPLVPFKSVAVDPRLIAIGEPIYVPELDGLLLPDGSVHDGCVRADDTGGHIKVRKMDFFVVTQENFKFLDDELYGVDWITPNVEDPRCQYLRDP
jgi:3D (Asp-Asp-Asp) domain-containing protein